MEGRVTEDHMEICYYRGFVYLNGVTKQWGESTLCRLLVTPCQTSSDRRRLHLFELLVKGALMENLTITGCWYSIKSVGYSPQPDGFWRQHLIHQLWRRQADAQLEVLVRRLAFSKEGECVCKLGSFRGVSRSKISGPGFLVYVFQGSKRSQQGSDLVITGPRSWALIVFDISAWWLLVTGETESFW